MGAEVPTYLQELAHRVRTALENETFRTQVAATIRGVLSNQFQLLSQTSDWLSAERQKSKDSQRAGNLGEAVTIYPMPNDDNPGRTVFANDWPLSTLHGIEDSPGCILHLGALNDYAAKNPASFCRIVDAQPLVFRPLHPFGEGGEGNAGAWFIYGTKWVANVALLKPEHEARLRGVIERALGEWAAVGGYLPNGPAGTPVSTANEALQGNQLSVSDRMLLAWRADPTRIEWTADQWARELKCSPGTVKKTATWKNIMTMRQENQLSLESRSR